MTTEIATRRRRVRAGIPRPGRGGWEAFRFYGVSYEDAMKAVADARRELQRRIEAADVLLGLTKERYLSDAGEGSSVVDRLSEIHGWFSSDLETACRVLRLDPVEAAERAAILEFDAGFTRRQAEIRALREFLRYFGRYDGPVREVVDSGEILDLARDLNLEREARRLIAGNPSHPVHPLPRADPRGRGRRRR